MKDVIISLVLIVKVIGVGFEKKKFKILMNIIKQILIIVVIIKCLMIILIVIIYVQNV